MSDIDFGEIKQSLSNGICTLARKMTSFRQSENIIARLGLELGLA